MQYWGAWGGGAYGADGGAGGGFPMAAAVAFRPAPALAVPYNHGMAPGGYAGPYNCDVRPPPPGASSQGALLPAAASQQAAGGARRAGGAWAAASPQPGQGPVQDRGVYSRSAAAMSRFLACRAACGQTPPKHKYGRPACL